MDLTILAAWWVLGSFVAAAFTPKTRLGFFGTLLASLFFSPAVGVIVSVLSGEKAGNTFEQHVAKKLNEISETLSKMKAE